jgi:hypothetical protein
MMNADAVKSLLESVTLDQVMSVYSGKKGKCYCGCSGNHRYASAHREIAGQNRGYPISDDEVNDRQVKRVLGIVKANFTVPEDCPEGCEPYHVQETPSSRPGKGSVSHFTAEVGDRSYTVYLLPK